MRLVSVARTLKPVEMVIGHSFHSIPNSADRWLARQVTLKDPNEKILFLGQV